MSTKYFVSVFFIIPFFMIVLGCTEQLPTPKEKTATPSRVSGYILRDNAGELVTNVDTTTGTNAPLDAHTTLSPSHVRGARIYDNFFIELDEADPGVDNPLIAIGTPTDPAHTLTGMNSYRCSQCHGFDYEGGIYTFNNGATNNLLELRDVRGRTEEDVFHLLMNGFHIFDGTAVVNVHNYSTLLTEQAIVDVSDFVVNEIFDTHVYIRAPTSEGLGDITEGMEIYNSQAVAGEVPAFTRVDGSNFNCVDCHGDTGNLVAGVDLYTLAWSNPFEWLHRVNFGSPRSLATYPDITAEDATVHPGLYEVVLTHALHFGGAEQASALLEYAQNNLVAGP